MAIFYNQATLIHNGQQTNSNTTTGEVLDTLAFTKTAIYGEYEKGGTVSYLITFTNNGRTALTDITLSDNLGEYGYGTGSLFPLEYIDGSLLYFVDGVPTNGIGATVADGNLIFSGITLGAGSTAQIIYTAQVNEFAPLDEGAKITNTATLACSSTSVHTATATVSASENTVLSIAKFICPDAITCSGELTYTFVIQNTGNVAAVATDDIIITDTFTPPLNINSVAFNDTELSEGVGYTYDTTSGAFTTLAGQITVPEATFTRSENGSVITTPGVSVLTVIATV